MPVTHVEDSAHFGRLIHSAGENKVVVVDFSAEWCGPCKMIAPIFTKLSDHYRQCLFLKVDVDECPDVAGDYSVSAMPTFVFLKNKKEVGRLKGANPAELEATLKKVAGEAKATSTFEGAGNRLGGEGEGGGSKVQVEVKENEVEKAQKALGVDSEQPLTKVNLRLADGTRFTVTLNLTHPVSKLRDFICSVRPDQSNKSFTLLTTFPNKEIGDETVSIKDAGVANAVVVQKLTAK